MEKQPRILVIRGGAIGDFIVTLPAIGALRERWPEAHIEILGYARVTPLAVGARYAQKARSIDYAPMSSFFVEDGELDAELSAYFTSFDWVISYFYDPDEIFANNLKRAGVKHLIMGTPHPTELHATAHLAKPLESLAIYVTSPQPKVYPAPDDLAFAAQFLGSSPEPWCAIHCGSGGDKKNWPVEFFADIGCWWRLATEANVLAICGEADEAVTTEFVRLLGLPRPLIARGLSLTQLAAVLSRCAVYVGNDSGVTHLAAAVGVPTVALWWPQSPSTWQPVGERVEVIPFNKAAPDFVRERITHLLKRSGGLRRGAKHID